MMNIGLEAFVTDEFRVYQWLDTSPRRADFLATLYTIQRRRPDQGWVFIVENHLPVVFETFAAAEAECLRLQNANAPILNHSLTEETTSPETAIHILEGTRLSKAEQAVTSEEDAFSALAPHLAPGIARQSALN